MLRSHATTGTVHANIDLDVHDIASLSQKKQPPTDDCIKYDYTHKKGRYSKSASICLYSLYYCFKSSDSATIALIYNTRDRCFKLESRAFSRVVPIAGW